MKDLTKGSIYQNFFRFAFPLVLAGALSQGYNLIDTVIAGKYIGDQGLAAIGATSGFITFSSAIFWGYGSGAAVRIASSFGAKQYKEIKSGIYHCLLLTVLVVLLYGLIVIGLDDLILQGLQVDKAIYAEARIYLDIYMGGLFFVILSTNCVNIMNALGLSSFPFFMSLISAVLNIIGNIFSVVFLDLGVAGIGISTVASAFVVDVLYILKLRKCFGELQVRKEKISFDWNMIGILSRYGIPVSLQQLVMYVAGLVILPMVNVLGSGASAAYTVVLQLYNLNAGIYQNSAKTVCNYAAQCCGAGKTDALKKGIGCGLLQGIVFLMPLLLVCIFGAKAVCQLFFPENYVGVGLSYAILFAQFYLPFIVINLVNNLFHAFYRGIGAMNLLLIFTIIGVVSRIGFSMVLVRSYEMEGIYLGWVLSWVTEAVLTMACYASGIWKRYVPYGLKKWREGER